jgi:FtsP/CotA-like multicopper oxidase with cupredoxin domain
MPTPPNGRQLTSYFWGISACTCVFAVVVALLMQATSTQATSSNELIEPAVCSSIKPIPPSLKGICTVTPLPHHKDYKRVKVSLVAETAPIEIGGYTVTTENYNKLYLPPVIEAKAGDTVAATLVNQLASRGLGPAPTQARPLPKASGEHKHDEGNPTNLHYFHGGIVTPRNARQIDVDAGKAGKSKGDNIYVVLPNALNARGRPQTVEYDVPIPGEKVRGKKELHGGVLEAQGWISHPDGLNWYHSHLHGRSSDQVMGGMSGLLSVGEDKANVRAKCATDPPTEACNKDTADLKKRTIVRYALLRDISLRDVTASPDDPAPGKKARWAPEDRDFPGSKKCRQSDPRLRRGFCQREDVDHSAWLFTLNGQVFPTITVKGGQNLLLRLGNLSANVTYWLELQNESGAQTPPPPSLTVLSLDGVVPARPGDAGNIDAFRTQDLLLMPASRAEIYVRNDSAHTNTQVYILRAKELNAGTDVWPEIQLAQVVLEPNNLVSTVDLARNAPTQQMRVKAFTQAQARPAPLPQGCVRDLSKGEYRRVTFREGGVTSSGVNTDWNIITEIMRRPRDWNRPGPEGKFESDKEHAIEDVTNFTGVPFEEYLNSDGGIDWLGIRKKHVCISLDDADQSSSRKQLWVLKNDTSALHNFHIHQMKFRLARKSELESDFLIEPPKHSHACADPNVCTCSEGTCTQPDYRLYEDDSTHGSLKSYPLWHDTIPVPSGATVFVVMSFTAEEQIGRYVFHCHILKHEDKGLMAPMEVWALYPQKFGRQ